ncbi:TonB-dependent receptor plug domain-containing protein [Taibaiella soli]|uniref:TonB-dependent receptor n=1 Tax=Taibaiella soli TaxID=1649169 RepID=A0A2W2ANL5_9BACT|nr:TonB-dependent receptor [Taibaiella soli]PZF73950.1 hypothetical protein DN068_06315 [Taibaiella soli]
MKNKLFFYGGAALYFLSVSGIALPATAKDKKDKNSVSVFAKDKEDEVGGDNTNLSKKDFSIKEVVVTGQYAPGNTEKAVQKIKLIDSKKIQAMSAQNLKDVLSNELNVRLSQDNILGSSLNIQGVGGESVKILIDGVPVIGRQDGNIDLSQISLSNIDRIEIVEGPMAVNYGTDALAGTINLITKKTQKEKWSAGLSTYYESIGTYNVNGRLGFHKGNHHILLSGGRNFFDGWRDGEKPFSVSFAARAADSNRVFQWKPKEQYFANLQYIYQIGKTTFTYKGDYFNELITNRGTPYAYGEKASDDDYRTIRFDNAVFMSTKLSDDKNLNVQVAYNDYKRISNTYLNDLTTLHQTLTDNAGDQDTSLFHQWSSRGTYSTSKANAKINYEVGYDVNLEDASGLRIKNTKQTIGDYAAFTSAEYRPVENLTIRPGVRYAYNTAYKAPLIPSVNVRYKLDAVTFRASFAQGFRSPSLKELYFDFHDSNHDIDGNPNLKPEYSNSYNLSAGYTKRVGSYNYKIDASGFYNDMHDRIELAQTGAGVQYSYVNIGRYKTLGVQANVELSHKGLKVLVGGSYTGRYNSLSQTSGVSMFSYSPEMRCNISYEFATSGITVNFFYKYNGSLPGFALDEKGKVTTTNIAAYNMGDISVAKAFFDKRVNITIGSKNIFDVKTLSVTGSVADASSPHSAGTSMPIGTGRYYFLRLDFNLNKQ